MHSPLKIKFVVATRVAKADFFTKTATGRSLALYKLPIVEIVLQDKNSEGLPKIYNRAIESAKNDPAIMVFAHDDLHLSDFYWVDQLVNSLKNFQIIGVAGNKRRVPNQPGWAFIDQNFTWDAPENLSGVVGHGSGFPPTHLNIFGPVRQEVKLLDGLLLASHSETLHANNLRFDERFDFHFYDLDFCRQAESKGVRMGTWTFSVIHESGGSFGSDGWRAGLKKYFDKWGD